MKKGEFKENFNKTAKIAGTALVGAITVLDPVTYVVLAWHGVNFLVDRVDDYLSTPDNIPNPVQDVELSGDDFQIINND